MRRAHVVALSVALLLIQYVTPFAAMFPQVSPTRAATQSNLVKNGDFSLGLSDWTTVKVQPVGSYPTFDVVTDLGMCTPSDRVGNPFLSIVVPFGADGYVEQSVSIPTTGAALSFASWGWENNDPIYGISGLVNARVAIVDAFGTEHTLQTFIPPPMLNPGNPNNPNDDTCTGNSPVLKSYDLSAFSGQTVKLRIGATSQNCCGTNALFDDVNIEASEVVGGNQVTNGDFSGGLSDWTAVNVSTSTGIRGEYPIFEVLTESRPPLECMPSERRGNPFLSIEVPFGADGYIEQANLAIPAGARLSFLSWGWEGSNPELGFRGLVDAYVRIVDANGVEHTLETYTPPPMLIPGGGIVPDACTGNSPVLKSYDLSAFSGQTVKLRIGATSQNCCGTDALFDDVVISAGAGTQSARVLITASPGGSLSYAFAGGSGSIAGGTSKVISASVGDSLSLTAVPSSGSAFSIWDFTTGVDTTFNQKPLDRTSLIITPIVNGNGLVTAKFSSPPTVTNLLINANSSIVTEDQVSSSRITATVLDQYGMPISGLHVDFASTKGILSSSTSITNSFGHASVTLTPNLLSSTAVAASVSASTNGLTALKTITFVPPQPQPGCKSNQNWESCEAFHTTRSKITIPQAVGQLPVVGIGTNTLLSPALNDYPIAIYSLSPTCSTDACKTFFTSNLQTQFGISFPTGYLATQTLIVELPLISILNNAVCRQILTINIGCLTIPPERDNGDQWAWGLSGTTTAGITPYIRLTPTGSLDLAITFSTNPNAHSTMNLVDLASKMAQLLISLVKPWGGNSQQALLNAIMTVSTGLSALANEGDVTLSIITSDLSGIGTLSSYVVFDFDDFANSVSTALDRVAVVISTGSSKSLLKIAEEIVMGGGEIGTGDVLHGAIQIGRCVLDTVNMAIQYVVSQPPLSDDDVAKTIANAFGIVVSIIDPIGSTIIPSYYDTQGKLVLGYNATSGTAIFQSSAGVIFATGDTYYAYLLGGGNLTVRLNTIGTAGVLVPYELETYNEGQVVATQTRYAGLLRVGNTIDIDVEHAVSDGGIVPQLSVAPTVQVVGNRVSLIPVLSNGTRVLAESAFVLAGSQVYQMDKVNSTLFTLDLTPAPEQTVLAAYVVVDGFVGGYATVTIPTSTGSLKVTVSGPTGPIESATVTIVSGPSEQMPHAQGRTGADGTVVFVDLIIGTYSYTVAAIGYQESLTMTVTLTARQTTPEQVILQPNPDFNLKVDPVSITIQQGSSGTSTISLTPFYDFNGAVILSSPNLPTGVTTSFAYQSVSTSQASTVTIAVASSIAGSYIVQLNGTSGSKTHSAYITVTVMRVPNTIFGIDPMVFYSTVGGVLALIAVSGAVVVVRRYRRRTSKHVTETV